jgi:hypothetical protein
VGGDLPGTVKDATALHDLLVNPERAAYPPEQVELLTGETKVKPTRQNILQAFERLISHANADPDSTAVVYYSGHGGRIIKDGEPSLHYLVPHGYDPLNKPETSITGQEFTDLVARLKARKLMVILDCCFAGGMPIVKADGGEAETFESVPMPPELNALALGGGQVIVTSSRAGEVSMATATSYSVFTSALLGALGGKGAVVADGYARVLNVLAYVLAEVPARTCDQQHPFVKKILDLDDNFAICYYAAGSKAAPDAALPPAPAPPPVVLGPAERQQLTVERNAQQQALQIVTDRLNAVRGLHAAETNATIRYQYEQRTLVDEAEVAGLKARIAELTAALTTPASKPPPDPHLIQQRAELQAQYDLLSPLIAELRTKVTLEYNPALRFQFSQQIREYESQRELLWSQIQAIDAALAAGG